MSTLTNYNVKVALDWASPPTEDKAVIFDLSENKFVLGAAGSSGITVNSNPATSGTGNVSATTLTFTNGKVTQNPTGTAVVDSIWFNNDALNFGNLTGLGAGGATAGFTQDGTLAKTHVTPQFVDTRTTLLTIQTNETESLANTLSPYPNNYITYGEVFLNPDPNGDGHTSDPPTLCLFGKINNTTDGNETLTFQNATTNDVIVANPQNNDDVENFLSVDDVVILFPSNVTFESPNFITAAYDGLVSFAGQTVPQFTIQSVTYDASLEPTGGYQPNWCLFISNQQFLTLEIGGESLGQLSLRSTGSMNTDPRSGVLITSAPNIYFFQPGAKTTTSGSLQPASASAAISFDLNDGALDFKVSGTSSAEEIPQTMLYVSKSGNEPRIGIGTKIQYKLLMYKKLKMIAQVPNFYLEVLELLQKEQILVMQLVALILL